MQKHVVHVEGRSSKCGPKNYTSRGPKQLRTDGQAQTCQQLVAFCASTRMNQNDAVVNPVGHAFHFFRTFFRETRDRSLRARRPTGVGQDIALQRRAGVRVANVGGELAGARSERSLRCDCEHLPPPAPVRGCDRRALRRGAGESSALRDAVEEGLSLLAHLPPTSRASTVRRHRRAR